MNQKEHKTLTTLDSNTLMAWEFEPLRFTVEKIFLSSRAAPKSASRDCRRNCCQAVATGGNLWEYSAEQSNVLYLALEDYYNACKTTCDRWKPKS